MSTYREIVGKKIKKVSSDPSTGLDGEMWYNSTTGTLRGLAVVEAFISSTSQPEAKRAVAGFGTQTALVVAAGVPPPGSASNTTIEYNGSGWFSGTNTPTSHYNSRGFGTQTAGAILGGVPADATTFEYDGSSWTAGGEYPANINLLFTSGAQTAGIGAGGHPAVTTSNTYNGSSWTSAPAINTGRGSGSGAGTTSAMVIFGGGTGPNPGISNATEEYDGSSWTSVTNIPAATQFHGTAGSQTAAVYFGGNKPAVTNNSFTYNGSTFTAGPNLGTSRYTMATGTLGTQTAAICAGGFTGTANTAATEEFNKSTNVITAGAWASANSMVGSAREHIGGAGSSTSGLAFGGESAPTNYNETEEWNGSSWTAGGAYPSKDESIMGCGLTASTALAFGGIGNVPGSPPITRQVISAKYDGSSWTTTNSLPTAKRAGQGFGINTSAVCMGGDTSPTATQNTVEEWDGTNWAAVPNAPFAKGNMGGGTGTLTAGLVFGGQSGTATGTSYEYDGTNWTAGGTMATARTNVNGFGGPAGQTASICAGGYSTTQTAVTEGYDGTAWSSRPSLGTARMGSANGIGTSQTAGVQAGGHDTSTYVTTVEEWTGDTSTTNIADFTTS